MRTYCQENLNEIKKVLLQLTNEQYDHKAILLSQASIGQHIRHIVEFYQCVLLGLDTKIVNYDNRKRNLLIETDRNFAIKIINAINSYLDQDIPDETIVLEGNFCAEEGKQTQIKTSIFRELAYCLEHSIHHQALIKVGLLELDRLSFIDDTFGLAPATIRYRKVCVQ
ncbi:MAG: DinB family protein [Flavobacterium sp.]|uniref:DinB family protein n=1 Tax=Flavobacterium sp. TaxID=239 RepID=UPI0026051D43|nr:DinB family protein [Flavobacterium sp.]MDD5150289.1 DinB family protein [Flavobacterium sp.]